MVAKDYFESGHLAFDLGTPHHRKKNVHFPIECVLQTKYCLILTRLFGSPTRCPSLTRCLTCVRALSLSFSLSRALALPFALSDAPDTLKHHDISRTERSYPRQSTSHTRTVTSIPVAWMEYLQRVSTCGRLQQGIAADDGFALFSHREREGEREQAGGNEREGA